MHRYEQISPSLNLLYLYFRKVFLSSQTDILMETCKLIARLGKFSKFPDKINIRDVLHEFCKGAERESFLFSSRAVLIETCKLGERRNSQLCASHPV